MLHARSERSSKPEFKVLHEDIKIKQEECLTANKKHKSRESVSLCALGNSSLCIIKAVMLEYDAGFCHHEPCLFSYPATLKIVRWVSCLFEDEGFRRVRGVLLAFLLSFLVDQWAPNFSNKPNLQKIWFLKNIFILALNVLALNTFLFTFDIYEFSSKVVSC